MPNAMDHNIEHHESENQTHRNIIFGKYEIGRLLGQGTFAKVYYGKNITTDETVAIKVISKEEMRKAGMTDPVQREISVMKLVRHPNVVEIKEVLATKGRIYFIMEYVKGGELFTKVAKNKLKEEYAHKYFKQLISAVDYCHSRGVSHRDLKPENLLLDDHENLKVSDFGLSALPEQLRQDGLLHTQCGTPAYVAPEVLRQKGYDGAKVDIWSCGVILYVLLSGFLPFQDINILKMYRKIFKAEFEYPPWFPNDAKKLVSKLLVVDPTRRLSIQGIMRHPWFKKEFKCSNMLLRSVPGPIEVRDEHEVLRVKEGKLESPRFYNAFEFISSMSSGFDLSSLFEKNKRLGSLFTSKCSAKVIMSKFEALGRKLNFQVSFKEFKLKMEGRTEGRKGRLQVVVEVFEVAEEVAVVEFSKASGDTLEYVKFCEEDVRPSLKDIVWSWQGESNCQSNCNV